jgi:hypothetical protein
MLAVMMPFGHGKRQGNNAHTVSFLLITPGTYIVNVLDTGGCTETATVILSNPTQLFFCSCSRTYLSL